MRKQNCLPELSGSKGVLEALQTEIEIEQIRKDKQRTDQEKLAAIAALQRRRVQKALLERIIVY